MVKGVGILLKLLVFPFRVVGRILVKPIGRLWRPVLRQVDRSTYLSTRISRLSSSMATQRGLLLMVGTGLLIVSLASHAVVMVLMVTTGSFDRNLYWLCIPFTLFHLGVLAGFTGAMLATPLGQGYKDK